VPDTHAAPPSAGSIPPYPQRFPVTVRSPLPDPSAPQPRSLLPRPPARGRSAGSRRLAVLGAVAGASLIAGLVVGGRHEPSERTLAASWARAWERSDYAAMHALLSPEAQRAWPIVRFQRAYRDAASTATLARLELGRPELHDGTAALPAVAHTRNIGDVRAAVELPIGEGSDGSPAIGWRPDLVFPGLRRGEPLTRETRMPPRATIEARDGTPLAMGDARLSDLGPVAAEVAGRVGPASVAREAELAARGVPAGGSVGLTGLELQFDPQLAGTPGGELRAGSRVLASSAPRRGSDVRTTIDPAIQRAAVTALAGRYGGVAAVRPSDGEVLALAGIASAAPQPPGSTFKIITLASALEAGAAKPSTVFPAQTQATLEGVALQNANGESCGGTLIASFAESCNSVFAPLGVRIGARALVATAERFGFNADLGVAGAARATIPAAGEIGDDLALGSTAIGQGKVLSTPLHLALVAAAIGEHGQRPQPTFAKGAVRPRVRATSARVARIVGRAMRAVVAHGTGVAAAIPGVVVAGKTGTAELRSTVSQDPAPTDPALAAEPDTSDTDAWFAAFAPARRPRIAVSVLLVAQGAGGDTAAPVARAVLQAGL
jgi:peptidoglycan glycosyltransferase